MIRKYPSPTAPDPIATDRRSADSHPSSEGPIDEQARSLADRLAARGYRVLAPYPALPGQTRRPWRERTTGQVRQ
ncbi:MAG TPA: hypothetical protein VNV66_20480 [Pilimelia sp.]|nr:hypothetical protein [Pilimelia sp.]